MKTPPNTPRYSINDHVHLLVRDKFGARIPHGIISEVKKKFRFGGSNYIYNYAIKCGETIYERKEKEIYPIDTRVIEPINKILHSN